MKIAAFATAIALSLPVTLGALPAEPLYADETPQAVEAAIDAEAAAASPESDASAFAGLASLVEAIDVEQMQHDAQVGTLLNEALSYEGTPYVYGGTTPGGFDCSGFVQYCFRTALGQELPRTSGAQAAVGVAVPLDELQPGDLVFWGSGAGAYHVGIAVDANSYIHAAGSGQGVVVDTLAYYCPSFAMRVL